MQLHILLFVMRKISAGADKFEVSLTVYTDLPLVTRPRLVTKTKCVPLIVRLLFFRL